MPRLASIALRQLITHDSEVIHDINLMRKALELAVLVHHYI